MFFNQLPTFDDFPKLVEEVKKILQEVKFSEKAWNQISLQVKNDTNPNEQESWWQSIGKIKTEERILIESEFNIIHEKLHGTTIEKWLNSLDKYGIVRARILVIPPKTTYSVHKDPTPRIHLPIVTNINSYVCFPDYGIMKHLPADGSSWFVDTRHNHTAINCGLEQRIHIVGVVTKY